jgi:hypothetical protein
MMFNELYTDWFAKKETLDASQYFIKTDNFIYNNELVGETIKVHIGAIIAFDLIPRSALSKSCSECNMYSQMAAQISSILLDTFSAITPDQMSVIIGPFIHTKNADKLNTLISKLSEYGDKYKISIEDAVRAVFVLNTDNAIAEQTLVHKIKNNQTNQWIKYADVGNWTYGGYAVQKIVGTRGTKEEEIDMDLLKHYFENDSTAIARHMTQATSDTAQQQEYINKATDEIIELTSEDSRIPVRKHNITLFKNEFGEIE